MLCLTLCFVSPGSEVMKIEAKDLDEPESHNSDIRYRIVNQEPEEPSPSMFTINPETRVISVSADGFDRKVLNINIKLFWSDFIIK